MLFINLFEQIEQIMCHSIKIDLVCSDLTNSPHYLKPVFILMICPKFVYFKDIEIMMILVFINDYFFFL